jgi:4-hydroxy-tetrahydrodipicolinate reductase
VPGHQVNIGLKEKKSPRKQKYLITRRKKMIRIAVSGAAGRMGSRIITISRENKELSLVGAIEHAGHDSIGNDIGETIGIGKIGVTISSTMHEISERPQVLIDFSSPEATLNRISELSKNPVPMVIGTTGFSKEQVEKITSYVKNTPCVLAPNMSVGVNLLLKILSDIARITRDDYDVEIVEAHHRMKKDAPSGTALKMASVIASALHRNLDECAIYTRKGIIGKRSKKEIGIQTIRAGDIVGEHTVIFGGLGERIEVTHRASSRDTFARGALRAAIWVINQKPGLYDMQDVLGLK